MKIFLIKAFVVFIRIIYAPMKLKKTQNKILWLSRQSDDKSLDMLMLEAELKKELPEAKQSFRLKKLRDEGSLSLSYIFSIFSDMAELVTARLVIVDTYSIPVSCLKHKKDLSVIQLWHAAGAVKKFSLQAAGKAQGRDKRVCDALCMHKNYDIVIAPSEATANFYCDAFGCSESAIRLCSLPRIDLLLDGCDRRQEFIKLNPQFAGKRIVLYLPTFRDGDGEYLKSLRAAFENEKDILLLSSVHPLSRSSRSDKINGKFTTSELLKLTDCVITDYSACAFEAALLKKRLYFFVPDYEKYCDEQGVNIDLKSALSNACFNDEDLLLNAVKGSEYDFSALEKFSLKYSGEPLCNNTSRLAKIVKEVYGK